MKIIFNIIKWIMIIVGIYILTSVRLEQGKMKANCHSRMATIIINPKANGFLTLSDNYEYTEGVFLNLKTSSALALFKENKIKLYVKNKGDWNQLKVKNTSQDLFYISRMHHGETRLIELKYEVNIENKSSNLIILEPYRIYCGMEFLQSIPKALLGLSLILLAFIGETIWFIIAFYRKRKTNEENSIESATSQQDI
jgi:hypothetical protein